MPKGYDFFISHSNASMGWSRSLAYELGQRGYSVFYDENSVPMGAPIEDSIRSALNRSHSVILVMDPSSASSQWAAFELGAALGMQKNVVAVVSSDVSSASLPTQLKSVPSVRMGAAGEVARELIRIVQAK